MSLVHASRIVLLVFLATAGCSGSASAQSTLGRQAVHPREIDGVMIERTVEVEIDAEGRQRHRERRLWEILTDYAMDYHSDPELWFDSERQTLDVAVARTTMADGAVVETPENGFNELLPGQLIAAPAYGGIRRTIVTHIGIEPGARAELDYTIADRQPITWSPGGSITLAGPLPSAKVHFALKSARGSLRSACIRCPEGTKVREQQGGRGHTYEFDDLDALNTYELGRHVGDNAWATGFVPCVVYATASSWRAEVQGLARRVEKATVVTEAIRARARELTRDEASLSSRVEALQTFVASAVDTVGVELWRLGFDPVAADTVLTRSYGSQLDKAVLLEALLSAIGVESHVVLLSDESQIAEEVPWLGQFEQVWIVANVEGRELWMPVEYPHLLLMPALPGDRWLVRCDRPGDPVHIRASAPEASSRRLVATLAMSGNGEVTGTIRLTAGGAINPYFSLRARSRGGEGAISSSAGSLGLSIVDDSVRVSQFGPIGIDVEGRLEGTRRPEGEGATFSLRLPWSPGGGLDHMELRETRATPLVIPGPRLYAVRVTISIPSGWRPIGLPENVEIRHDVGWFVQEVSTDGRRIEITRELGLRRRVVEPEGYEHLREILVAAGRMATEVLILEADPS